MKRIVALVFIVAGCGPTNMVDFCRETATRTCKRLFQCGAASATSLYADEAACTADMQMKTRCELFTDYPCDVDASKANACLSAVDQFPCTSMSPESTAAATAPCRDPGICKLRPGVIQCRSNNNSSTNNVCSSTRTECTDGKTYAITCNAGMCTCSTDGANGATFQDAGFCNKSSQDRSALLKSKCNVTVF